MPLALESTWTRQSSVASSLTLTILLLLFIAALCFAQWLYECATTKPEQRRLRPKWTLPWIYNTHQLIYRARARYDWFTEQCAAADTKTVWVRVVGNPDFAVLSTPELFEDVLKTHFNVFEKGFMMTDGLRDLLGSGIFAVDGLKWAHQRKTVLKLFSMRALRESMAESVHKHTVVLHEILQRASELPQQPIDFFSLMNRFTIETFAEIGFGVELGCLDSESDHPFQNAFDSAQRAVAQRIMCPPVYWKVQRFFNIGNERGLKSHIQVIDDTVLGIVSQSLENRRTQTHAGLSNPGSEKKRDIVSLFLDSVSSSSDEAARADAFDPVFLRDIVVNFLIAGRDTTAQALSWFFYCLSQHPEVERKIRDELTAQLPELLLLGDSDNAVRPSLEDTHKLVYLEAALRETLRLYPSVPVNVKLANQDVLLSDGTLVRQGEGVLISSYVLGRMPHVWGSDAREFKPERWLDPASRDHHLLAVSSFQFNAFHAGPRMCLGMNLAMMEMKIVAAKVLSSFHIELAPGQNGQAVTYDISLTHPIKGKLLVTVARAKH